MELRTVGSSEKSETVAFLIVAASFASSLLLGGSGNGYPYLGAFIQLVAVFALWELAATGRLSGAVSSYPLPFLLLFLILAVPLLQLLPLPPDQWERLSGRKFPAEILKAAGVWGEWRPLSFDPNATVQASLELLPAIVMFVGVLHLQHKFRLLLGLLLIAVAAVSATLGALQTLAGDGFILFATAHEDAAPGLFVNRNHQATFLLIAMMITAALGRSLSLRSFRWHPLTIGTGLILWFATATIATASRAGLALLPIALLTSGLILFRPRMGRSVLLGYLVALPLLVYLASLLPRVQLILGRFADTPEKRGLYWEDTIVGIERYWPWGSGIGTFRDVFETVESLNVVGAHRVNNAHNDYLELLLEGGAASSALLILFLAAFLLSLVRIIERARRSASGWEWAAAAWVGVFLILAHSILDYPLRMMSIMATMGYLMAILVADLVPRRGATLLTKAARE